MGPFLCVAIALSTLASSSTVSALTFPDCPILGPVFPPPKNLNASVLQDAFQNLTQTLNDAIAVGNSTHGPVDNDTAYAVQFFSSYEATPAFQWYYTPLSIRNGSFGTKNVDGDSIFRIGSVTKLFTVYALLAEVGDLYWDQPVTQFLPELDQQSQESQTDPINFLRWNDVTLGALASHLAGVTRDLESDGGISAGLSSSLLLQFGLPLLSQSEMPSCFENTTSLCDRSQFLAALSTRQPVYAPNTTPIYSNTGFQILAYALESIAGRPLSEILQERIFSPLSLSSTFTTAPANDSQGVIPGDPGSSGWNFGLSMANGYNGIYTSASDLATVGKSILNSTLLSPNITRAWLKPVTHTSSMTLNIGRPWEIARQTLDAPYEHVTDLYTKSGVSIMYQSRIALLPDYNVGWVTMSAGPGDETVIDELILDALVSKMEAAAREQAASVYSGTYTAATLNSSITLGTSPDAHGLEITKWVSNGTDAFGVYAALAGTSPDNVRVTLQPTNLESAVASTNATGNTTSPLGQDSKTKAIAFRAIYNVPNTFNDTGVIAESCSTWASMDGLTYGNYAVDQFVITVATDENGQEKAQSINPRFLHVTLSREE
ncbi:MAG: hypothetical protein M1822_002496 [Bathelium mastoideum]|nr:MAG: hypothetical protein M1822_002496 [Bathelium mastoideum]